MIYLTPQQVFFIRSCMAVAGVCQIITYLIARNLQKRNENQEQMLRYLIHICEQNNIELTEFDVIALKDLGLIK